MERAEADVLRIGEFVSDFAQLLGDVPFGVALGKWFAFLQSDEVQLVVVAGAGDFRSEFAGIPSQAQEIDVRAFVITEQLAVSSRNDVGEPDPNFKVVRHGPRIAPDCDHGQL